MPGTVMAADSGQIENDASTENTGEESEDFSGENGVKAEQTEAATEPEEADWEKAGEAAETETETESETESETETESEAQSESEQKREQKPNSEGKSSPKTGDESHMERYLMMLLVSLTGMGVCSILRLMKNRRKQK